MRSPIAWFVDWIDEKLERKHWQRSRTLEQEQERVTEGGTFVDLYDTCPIQRVVNASVPVSVPPSPPEHTPGPTTNVLRQYAQKQPHVRPMKLYKSLWQLALIPDWRRRDDR